MTVELGLGQLDEADRQLQRLFDLRIATRSTARSGEDVVMIDEIVRAAVHDVLSPEQRRVWHLSIARVLTEDLDVTWESLDVSGRFDHLEDCLTHMARATSRWKRSACTGRRSGTSRPSSVLSTYPSLSICMDIRPASMLNSTIAMLASLTASPRVRINEYGACGQTSPLGGRGRDTYWICLI
jgi:hypothetical protein